MLVVLTHVRMRDKSALEIIGAKIPGKYIPAIAHKIHTEDKKEPKIRINMKGMAIGDGFSDPINMLNYGNYLYNVGLIDEKERQHFHREEKAVRDAIRKEDWTGAFEVKLFCDSKSFG